MADNQPGRGCYLVIQPNPFTSNGTQRTSDRKTVFNLKFGDGNPSAYSRTNANYGVALNTNAPPTAPTYRTKRFKNSLESVTEMKGPGKYLEQHLINVASDPLNPLTYAGTEWHELELADGKDVSQLTAILREMLNRFPSYNRWCEGSGADNNMVPEAPAVKEINDRFECLVTDNFYEDDGRFPVATFSGKRYLD